jgi:sugar lactone lactonase YvrE
MKLDIRFERLADLQCGVGESPVWDDRRGCVFLVDIRGRAVHALALDGEVRGAWPLAGEPGSLALCEDGTLLVALGDRIVRLDPQTGETTPFAHVSGVPAGGRLNDGKVGPDGAFWVGSMDVPQADPPGGALYRVARDGTVTRHAEGLRTSNGLAWSPDGATMFHSDSRAAWIDTVPFDAATGTLGARNRLRVLDDAIGRPDGAACDALGRYWSAGVSAGRLNVFAADGTLEAYAAFPAGAPTMPCFCGADQRTLVVTSLRRPPDAAGDADGRVYIGRAPLAGAPVPRFYG